MKPIAYFIISVFLSSCFSKKPESTGKEGTLIPSFNLLLTDSISNFDTKTIPLGKPSLLFYFSPHCVYSRAQMKEITANIEDLEDINIYAFTSKGYSAMKEFYNSFSLNKYPNITCGRDRENYFKSYFNVPAVPYLAIYDKNKKLKQAFIGHTPIRRIKEIAEE